MTPLRGQNRLKLLSFLPPTAFLSTFHFTNFQLSTKMPPLRGLNRYENRLKLWNIGLLINPLSVDMLKVDHPSIKRNILIADVFYRSGAIEAWGRGIKLIVSEFAKIELPPHINQRKNNIFVNANVLLKLT